MPCEICELSDQTVSQVIDGAYWTAVVSPDQVNLGHCLVILKHHKPSISSLAAREVAEWHEIAKQLEDAIGAAFEPTLFDWTCLTVAEHSPGRNLNPHVFWHIIPRYEKAARFNGQTFLDPNFGHRYELDRRISEPALTTKIASTIRRSIP